MNCIPRRFSDIHLGSLGVLFYRHLHGGAPPVPVYCTYLVMSAARSARICRVPLTPSSVQTMSFMLVHSLLWR